jgi:hypothetical protein
MRYRRPEKPDTNYCITASSGILCKCVVRFWRTTVTKRTVAQRFKTIPIPPEKRIPKKKRCEVQLDEEKDRGNLVSEARKYIEIARTFFNKWQPAKALLYALRAQGMTAELLAR